MIISKLYKILNERDLRISTVTNMTGISRTTLTSLSYNTGNGIQYDTLSKLCSFLTIDISDLFFYIPKTIEVNIPEFILTPEINSETHQYTATILFTDDLDENSKQSINFTIDINRNNDNLMIEANILADDIYPYQLIINDFSNDALQYLEELVIMEISDVVEKAEQKYDLPDELNISFNAYGFKKLDMLEIFHLLKIYIDEKK